MAKVSLSGERWEDITTLCRQAVGTMLNFSLQHVGLPCGSADAAAGTAQAICRLFGLDYRQGGSSDFAGPFVECCKVDMRAQTDTLPSERQMWIGRNSIWVWRVWNSWSTPGRWTTTGAPRRFI